MSTFQEQNLVLPDFSQYAADELVRRLNSVRRELQTMERRSADLKREEAAILTAITPPTPANQQEEK